MKIFGMMGSGLVILTTTIVCAAVASKSSAYSLDSLQSERDDFYSSMK